MFNKSAFLNNLNTGRISNIIESLLISTGEINLKNISTAIKLEALCLAMNITPSDLDAVISSNSAVKRTVKGHAFEFVFDQILISNGIEVSEIGGDDSVDRIVNSYSLQLKTPHAKGTNKTFVEYKTHKTHGPKSEKEDITYLSYKPNFADFLVGLVSYDPFKIIIIPKEDIPSHISDSNYIKSPFKMVIKDSPFINNFELIGLNNLEICLDKFTPSSDELLPLSAIELGLNSNVIINTILNINNFRIWDMNIRGFIREYKLFKYFKYEDIHVLNTSDYKSLRADKSDFSLQDSSKTIVNFQIKGATLSGCKFSGIHSRVDIETQLSRGRVNDHPTQSRLYLDTDFDELILCLDPVYTNNFQIEIGHPPKFDWEFYSIPVKNLFRHPNYNHRINSHQYINYLDLQPYRIDSSWLNRFK